MKPVVYLIENESGLASILSKWITDWKYTVKSFKTVSDSVNDENTEPNAILIDLKLIDKKNKDLLKSKFRNEIPIVILGNKPYFELTEAYNFYDACSVPHEPERLKQILKNSVSYYQLETENKILKTVVANPGYNNHSHNDNKIILSDSVILNGVVPLEKVKEDLVRHAYDLCNGNILTAAKKLKIGRATMYRLLHKYDII